MLTPFSTSGASANLHVQLLLERCWALIKVSASCGPAALRSHLNQLQQPAYSTAVVAVLCLPAFFIIMGANRPFVDSSL